MSDADVAWSRDLDPLAVRLYYGFYSTIPLALVVVGIKKLVVLHRSYVSVTGGASAWGWTKGARAGPTSKRIASINKDGTIAPNQSRLNRDELTAASSHPGYWQHKSVHTALVCFFTGIAGLMWTIQMIIRGAEANMNLDLISMGFGAIYTTALAFSRIKFQAQLFALSEPILLQEAGTDRARARKFYLFLRFCLYAYSIFLSFVVPLSMLCPVYPQYTFTLMACVAACNVFVTILGPGASFFLIKKILFVLERHAANSSGKYRMTSGQLESTNKPTVAGKISVNPRVNPLPSRADGANGNADSKAPRRARNASYSRSSFVDSRLLQPMRVHSVLSRPTPVLAININQADEVAAGSAPSNAAAGIVAIAPSPPANMTAAPAATLPTDVQPEATPPNGEPGLAWPVSPNNLVTQPPTRAGSAVPPSPAHARSPSAHTIPSSPVHALTTPLFAPAAAGLMPSALHPQEETDDFVTQGTPSLAPMAAPLSSFVSNGITPMPMRQDSMSALNAGPSSMPLAKVGRTTTVQSVGARITPASGNATEQASRESQQAVWRLKLATLQRALTPIIINVVLGILLVAIPWLHWHLTYSLSLLFIGMNIGLIVATKQAPNEF